MIMGAKLAGASRIIGVDVNTAKFETGNFLLWWIQIITINIR